MVIPWISLATQQTTRKALSRKGCAPDLLKQSGPHCVSRLGIAAHGFELRRAPVDHPDWASVAAHGGLIQSIPNTFLH